MAKLGLLGIIIPPEYGGAGLDTISYATVVEEISRKCASTGVITSVHNSLAAWPIMKYGTEEQKKKYLPILAKGEKIGAFAGTEPNAGSDLGAMKTNAVSKDTIMLSTVIRHLSPAARKQDHHRVRGHG